MRPITKMNLEELRELEAADFTERDLSPSEFRHIFETCEALWIHSGDPKAPHAELTSGNCSDGFVDVLRVLSYTNLCEIMALQLVNKIPDSYSGPIDWVVGSDHAGATLSFAVASLLNARHDFTEKSMGKTQLWTRFDIQPGEVVLQVEELVTTTGTLQAVRDGIRLGNPHPVKFTPFALTLINRSPFPEFEEKPLLCFERFKSNTWTREMLCPLCAQGSKRVRPKQNWTKLTQKA